MNKYIKMWILLSGLLLSLLPEKSIAAEQDKLCYTNAEKLTIINKAQPTAPGFQRINVKAYSDLPPIMKRYYSYSTGVAITFRTNSRTIAARWTTSEKPLRVNVTPMVHVGLDLYIRKGNEWIFAGVGSPTMETEHKATLVKDMDDSIKECLLYLPLMTGTINLEIGVNEGSAIEALPNPFRHKVQVIGSSITHGLSASRPGMAYPAQLERTLGIEFCNLGASGQCKLNDFYAHIAEDIEADAFIFDGFSNPSPQQITERLPKLVERIRKAHPNVPLIFLQTEIRETGNFNIKLREHEKNKREAAEKAMKELKQIGYKDIYFLNPGMDLGNDHEATVDGVHPTDLGYARMLKKILPQVKRILHKYKIK